jgi:uncharacterized membrane protein YfcA
MLAHLALYVVLGAAFGLLGGLFGIGGGIVAIPILGLAFGMSQQAAQGTALVMVVPNVAIGLWRYYQKRSLNVRYAVTLALSAIPFTYAGARVATGLPSHPLRIAFATFTFVIAIYVLWKAFAVGGAPVARAPWYYSSIVGAIGGTLSGFFSVGGATFAVPAMAEFFGLTQASAQSMGLALTAPGTVIGLATYSAAGDVNWLTGAALAVGGVPAVRYGVDLAHRLPECMLKALFAVFLFAAALALLAEHA